ncbi:MAG: hypothetical protein EZS28_042880, partial [Streblomastix strix]
MDPDDEIDLDMIVKEILIMQDVILILKKAAAMGTINTKFLHVVEIYDFFVDQQNDGKVYLVLEFCAGGDMRHYIDDMKKKGTMISNE